MGEDLKWGATIALGLLLVPLVAVGVILALLCYGLALGAAALHALAFSRN